MKDIEHVMYYFKKMNSPFLIYVFLEVSSVCGKLDMVNQIGPGLLMASWTGLIHLAIKQVGLVDPTRPMTS